MKYRGIKGSGSSGLGEGGKGWLNDSALIAKACAGASFVGMIFLVSRLFYLFLDVHSTNPFLIHNFPSKYQTAARFSSRSLYKHNLFTSKGYP